MPQHTPPRDLNVFRTMAAAATASHHNRAKQDLEDVVAEAVDIDRPIEVRVGELALVGDTIVRTEIPETDTAAEHPPATRKEVVAAYESQRGVVRKWSDDPLVKAECEKEGIDYTSADPEQKGKYWGVVAKYTNEWIAKERKTKGDSLQLRALELLTAAPQVIIEQSSTKNEELSDAAKARASKLNALVRGLARDYRGTVDSPTRDRIVTAPDMQEVLESIAEMVLEPGDEDTHAKAQDEIGAIVRGAQHELAHGQLLANIGHEYRPAAGEQEDLKGIDHVIDEHTRYALQIDTKSSSFKMDARGANAVYTRTGNHVVMYSLIRPHELGEKFFVSDAVVQQKAPGMRRLIEQIQGDMASSGSRLAYASSGSR